MTRLSILSLTALCSLTLALTANAGPLSTPDYRGKLRFDSRGKVIFSISKDGRRVVFQARRIPITCDNGDNFRRNFELFRTTLRRDGSFDFDEYVVSGGAAADDQSIYRVHGQLLPGRRARGFLYSVYDPWDPPSEGDASECTTLGKRHWKAAGRQ